MLEALQKNKSIVQLEMTGNNVPSDTLKALGKSYIKILCRSESYNAVWFSFE